MPKYLDTRAAAQYLHDRLPGESVKYWSLRLNNLRRKDRRQPFPLNFAEVKGKSGYYAQDDLAQYVEFEKARRTDKAKLTGRAAELARAFGAGEPGGSSYGRKLAYTVMLGFEEGDVSKQFVRLMIERPLGVFRLEADEAAALAAELADAVKAIKRHAKGTAADKPDLSNYETVTDNATMRVMRAKGPK
jgi:hypothetical protein